MTSINTNNSAMFALQTLRSINKGIDETNNRVSTGLKINSAGDGAAYWSISSTLKSDNGALGAVKDAMSLDKNSVDAAYGGVTKVLQHLDNIKSKLTTATSANADRTKLQTEIDSYLAQIKSVSDNTVMNGDNWLSTDTTPTSFNAEKGIVSSFSRNGSSVKVETTKLDTSAFILYDKSTTGTNDGAAGTAARTAIATAATDANAAVTVAVGTAGEIGGFMDTVYDVSGTGIGGSAITMSVSTIKIDDLGDTTEDLNKIQTYIKLVDATMQQLQNGATKLGTASSEIGSNQEFVQKLIDINKSSIGALIDADLEEESTRLKALQTQQQL
ncbi:flagellin N-terminal helical domain-containing protein, partial [Microvirga lenta]|uniref:flagellin N-terminal helical domain-containing protein n=1 Tax=Microvirga lenta TaxID=2881337 RepID=UPI001CFD8049